MDEEVKIDAALAEIIELSAAIEAPAIDDRERKHLERRRSDLRNAVREAADAARPESGLRNELGALRRRLAQIDEQPIGKGWAEKGRYRWVNDPGAYAGRINEILIEQDADERAMILRRISEIEAAIEARRA